MQSEYKNFLLNVVYQVLTFVFPLITVPYISRVLGVENVGIYSYTYSIAYMFLLFGMLGLSNYGNREIAKVRDDRERTSERFSAIYSLQLIVNSITILAYVSYVLFFCREFLLIAELQIIYVASILFDVSWFYFGLEKFKMTITRNLLIKVISFVLIFMFVKGRDDLWVYALIMAMSTLLSQLYLFFNLRRYVYYRRPAVSQLKVHIKGVCLLFIPVLAYSIYRVMDKTMIGSLASVVELGYFDNAERLINIPIMVNTALGTVMLPRMAYLLANSEAKFRETILRSMQLALMLACTMAFVLCLLANDISLVMFGPEFVKSGTIIRWLSVTIIVSAWANVIRTQYIIPCGLDSIYVKSTIGGAIINLCSNLILIRLYGAIGACVGTILAESYVMLYQSVMCRKQLNMGAYSRLLLKYCTHGISIVLATWLICFNIEPLPLRLTFEILIPIIMFFLLERKYIVYDFFGKAPKS